MSWYGRFRMPRHAAYALRVVGAVAALAVIIVAGLFFRYPELGNGIIALYGLVSLIVRIPSGTTYMMAWILLATMPFLSAAGQDDTVQYFSVYAFLLLCIGTLAYVFEQRAKNSKIHR